MIAQLNKEYIKTRPTKAISRIFSYFFFEGRPLTTRGRWINPLLFCGYRAISLLPPLKKIKAPIFIIGTGRSGSTLLGMLLSMHKKTAFLNEPKAVWHFAFNKEDVIGSYSKGEAKYKLAAADVNEKTALMMKKLYGFYLASVFSDRIVDKYPELIFRIEFVKRIFPDAKFIFLQRNGFDTCASTEEWIKNHRMERNNEIEDWWGLNNRKWKFLTEQVVPESTLLSSYQEKIKSLNNQTDMSAVEWITAMEEGIHFQNKYPNSIMPVKYEDLTTKPELVLSEIFSFCNLENDDACIHYAKQVLSPGSRKNYNSAIAPFLENSMNVLMKKLGY